MPELLFVYWTLKDPDLQKQVLGREISGEDDILEHYKLSEIDTADWVYPIVIESQNQEVKWFILTISKFDFPALDEYESEAYKRVKVFLKSWKEVWIYK